MRYISVFRGVEAASVAWEPLGWEPVAFSEIDEFPSEVLRQRFPDVPNLGDITKVDWREYAGKVDLVVGGSPCQSFSVAGRREGLDGESGLMWEYVRCVREVRPRWFVWENVPGALSSSKGEDFRCLLESMDELGYGLAWRVLDAQFFGVPQRRRRVFLVGSLGNKSSADVLFEPESMLWDFETSREKRQRLAEGTEESTRAGCFKWNSAFGIGYEEEQSVTLVTKDQPAVMIRNVPVIGETFCGSEKSQNTDMAKHHECLCKKNKVWQTAGNIINRQPQHGGHQLGVRDPDIEGAFTLTTADRHAVVVKEGCYCIQGNMIGRGDNSGPEGAGISEDLSFTLNTRDRHAVSAPVNTLAFNPRQITSPQNGNKPRWNDACHCLAATDGAPNVICMSDVHTKSPIDNDLSGTLTAHAEKQPPIVSSTVDCRNLVENEEISGTLQAKNNGGFSLNYTNPVKTNKSSSSYVVRKLTPRECERLQGFPDDWTLIDWKGKPCPEGKRYKAMGNSMCVNVMRWIGQRIQTVDESLA